MHDSNYPSVDLSTEQKTRYAEVMVAGNTVLADLYDQVADRSQPHLASRIQFRDCILEAAKQAGDTDAFVVAGVIVAKQCFAKIKAVKDLEGELLLGYSAMICDIANKWSKKHCRGTIDADDLVQEGMLAMLKASIYYLGQSRNSKVCFSTYLWHAVDRRLMVVCLRDRIIPSSPESGKLLRRFEEARKEINGPANFDEIVAKLNLTDIEKYHLLAAQASLKVCRETDVRRSGYDGESKPWVDSATSFAGFDSDTFQSSGSHNGHALVVKANNDNPLYDDEKFASALAVVEAELDTWETAVLQGFLSGEYGWQERVSAENINPITNKRYSRRAPYIALQRIFSRLLEEYGGELKDFRFFRAG